MKLFRQYKGQLCCTLILFLAVLVMPFQDYTEQTFLSDAMHVTEGDSSLIEYTEDSLIISPNAAPLTLESGSYNLKKGTYLVVFHLLSQQEGSTVEICDPRPSAPGASAGKTLAFAEVPTTEESIRLNLTIEEPLAPVQFCIRSNGALTFSSVYLLSEKHLFQDPYLYAFLLLFASALLLLFRVKRQPKAEVLMILGLTILWSSLPLFLPMLLIGEKLPLYYARLLRLSVMLPFGLSPIGSYQLLLLCLNLATAILSYLAFSRLFRSGDIGLLAALVYTLLPWRLTLLYRQSDLTEILILAFVPLLILAACRLLVQTIPIPKRSLHLPFQDKLLSFAPAREWRQLLLIFFAAVMIYASGSYYHLLTNQAELLHWNWQMDCPPYDSLQQ